MRRFSRRDVLSAAAAGSVLKVGDAGAQPSFTAPSTAFPRIGVANFSIKTHPAGHLIEMLQTVGAQFLRCDLAYWSEVELTKGHLVPPRVASTLCPALREAGIGVIPLLMYGNRNYPGSGGFGLPPRDAESVEAFGRYASFIATQVPEALAYEIWNEPNNPPFFNGAPDPAVYAPILDAGTKAILASMPEAHVISAGIGDCAGPWGSPGPYMKAVLGASGASGQIRRLWAQGIHPYPTHGRFRAIETPEEMLNRFIPQYRRDVDYQGDLAVTESGYSGQWLQFDDELMAHLTARLLCAAVVHRVSLHAHYCLIDAGSDMTVEHNSFGLFRMDGTPKPAARAFRAVTDALAGAQSWSYRSDGPVRELALQKSGGRVSVVWNVDRSDVVDYAPLVTKVADCRDVLGQSGPALVTGGGSTSLRVPGGGSVLVCSGH